VDAEGCRTCFGGLVSIFVFDILQIPSGCSGKYFTFATVRTKKFPVLQFYS
jgi:hypothetical protein